MYDRCNGKYDVPKMFQKTYFNGEFECAKEGVFKGIEMASKKGFGSKDLLT